MSDFNIPWPRSSSFAVDLSPEIESLQRSCKRLTDELNDLRGQVSRREEAAYRNGLGDRAAVLEQNRILVAAITALTDRMHPANVDRRTPPSDCA